MNLQAWSYLMEGLTKDGVDCHSMRDDLGNGNAVEWETAIFLYGLIRRINPTNIIETGRHYGLSSCMMAMALKDNYIDYPNRQPGHIYTCDPDSYNGRPEEIWAKCEVSEYITNYIGNSYSYCPKMNGPADVIFYDADHSAEALVNEFMHFSQYMSDKKIYLLWHDGRLDPREAEGIRQIKKDLIPLLTYKHMGHFAMRNFRGFDIIYLSNEDL